MRRTLDPFSFRASRPRQEIRIESSWKSFASSRLSNGTIEHGREWLCSRLTAEKREEEEKDEAQHDSNGFGFRDRRTAPGTGAECHTAAGPCEHSSARR